MKFYFKYSLVFLLLIFSSTSFAQDNELRLLRDEAIENIGWVAGNSYGRPMWPQVKSYVGEGGVYYQFYLSLAPRESDHETEAYQNYSLYKEWFEIGKKEPFNEAEAILRIQRILQIQEELGKLFDFMKTE